jgi:hypothetical protein
VQGGAGLDGAGEIALGDLGQLCCHGRIVARRISLARGLQRHPDPRRLRPVAGMDPEAEGNGGNQKGRKDKENDLEEGHQARS